jgi:hypothetical protein
MKKGKETVIFKFMLGCEDLPVEEVGEKFTEDEEGEEEES